MLSTHLIDEAAELLERILVIDHGRLVLDALADDLRGNGAIVTGPTSRVERFVADRATLSRRTMGAHTTAVMAGRLDERDRELADHLRLHLDSVTLQQLAIYAAGHHDRLGLTEAGAP